MSEEVDWIPCVSGPLPDLKRMLARCEEAGIPAALWAEEACNKHGGCGCAPKVHLVAPPDELPRISALMRDEWAALVEKEGTASDWQPASVSEDAMPCPACGSTAELVEGACGDCGLQLG